MILMKMAYHGGTFSHAKSRYGFNAAIDATASTNATHADEAKQGPVNKDPHHSPVRTDSRSRV